MLYGAFVFDKTCIRGGCAIAIPNLFYLFIFADTVPIHSVVAVSGGLATCWLFAFVFCLNW